MNLCKQVEPQNRNEGDSSWGFQPKWKKPSQIGSFPQVGVKNEKSLKLPPRHAGYSFQCLGLLLFGFPTMNEDIKPFPKLPSTNPNVPNPAVDASEIRRSPVEVSSLPHYIFTGFYTSQVVIAGFLPSTVVSAIGLNHPHPTSTIHIPHPTSQPPNIKAPMPFTLGRSWRNVFTSRKKWRPPQSKTRWWLNQPIWKIRASQIGSFPPRRGENPKIFELPPLRKGREPSLSVGFWGRTVVMTCHFFHPDAFAAFLVWVWLLEPCSYIFQANNAVKWLRRNHCLPSPLIIKKNIPQHNTTKDTTIRVSSQWDFQGPPIREGSLTGPYSHITPIRILKDMGSLYGSRLP